MMKPGDEMVYIKNPETGETDTVRINDAAVIIVSKSDAANWRTIIITLRNGRFMIDTGEDTSDADIRLLGEKCEVCGFRKITYGPYYMVYANQSPEARKRLSEEDFRKKVGHWARMDDANPGRIWDPEEAQPGEGNGTFPEKQALAAGPRAVERHRKTGCQDVVLRGEISTSLCLWILKIKANRRK